MEISFVSSLNADDERRFAAALLRMISALLDLCPVAYSIRISTTSGKTFMRAHAPDDFAGDPAGHHLPAAPSGRASLASDVKVPG